MPAYFQIPNCSQPILSCLSMPIAISTVMLLYGERHDDI